jgi:hypothetical protein
MENDPYIQSALKKEQFPDNKPETPSAPFTPESKPSPKPEEKPKEELPSKFIDKRKEKIKIWLKNNYNLIFLAILILGIIIRFYFFSLTKTQPIWWDESDYLAYAKNLAGFPVEWIITGAHNSFFPYIVAFFFKIGSSEAITKFFIELVPSILLIILTYQILIIMYDDKRIALISSFLMATLWTILFNTMRFHVGVPALFFGFVAFFIFWQGYEKREKIFGKIDSKWAIPLAVLFVVLAYATRRGYFLFGFIFLLYMLITRKIKDLVKDKYNWIGLFIAIILIFFSEKYIFTEGIVQSAQIYSRIDSPFNLMPFDIFKAYFINIFDATLSPLYYLFYIGLILLTINMVLHVGYFKKSQNTELKSNLFAFLTIAITLSYFLFFQRRIESFGEPRWYFPLLLGAFICISKGTLFFSDYIKKYNKHAAILFIAILIGFGGYHEVKHANSIITNRATSFEGIRQASLYLKENSNPEDIIISVAVPQVMYYGERPVLQPDKIANWENSQVPFENFMEALREIPEAKYLLISFSQSGHAPWMTQSLIKDGQSVGWNIPFMETTIDFSTGQQNLVQSKTFGNITFTLLEVKQDVFIYRIDRI